MIFYLFQIYVRRQTDRRRDEDKSIIASVLLTNNNTSKFNSILSSQKSFASLSEMKIAADINFDDEVSYFEYFWKWTLLQNYNWNKDFKRALDRDLIEAMESAGRQILSLEKGNQYLKKKKINYIKRHKTKQKIKKIARWLKH